LWFNPASAKQRPGTSIGGLQSTLTLGCGAICPGTRTRAPAEARSRSTGMRSLEPTSARLQGSAQRSSAPGDAINADYRYLVVHRLRCDTHQAVALHIVRRPNPTQIHELERYMRCKDCSEPHNLDLRPRRSPAPGRLLAKTSHSGGSAAKGCLPKTAEFTFSPRRLSATHVALRDPPCELCVGPHDAARGVCDVPDAALCRSSGLQVRRVARPVAGPRHLILVPWWAPRGPQRPLPEVRGVLFDA
jgi:hypothetical protein